MLHFRELHLADYDLFQKTLEDIQYESSSCSFANLYLWRNSWSIRIAQWNDCLYFTGKHPVLNKEFYLQPLLPKNADLCGAFEVIEKDAAQRQQKVSIRQVEEPFLARVSRECPLLYDVAEDRDSYEYIYRTQDLVELSGKRYHGKRNHLHHFHDQYTYEYESLSSDSIDECLKIFDAWAQDKPCNDWLDERDVVEEAVRSMDTLRLRGCIIRVDGIPVAFAIGEQYHPDYALIHLEKALSQYEGLYVLVNQQFAQREWLGKVQFINRAEDMGKEGLRKAKLSYHPEKLMKKYTLTRG